MGEIKASGGISGFFADFSGELASSIDRLICTSDPLVLQSTSFLAFFAGLTFEVFFFVLLTAEGLAVLG